MREPANQCWHSAVPRFGVRHGHERAGSNGRRTDVGGAFRLMVEATAGTGSASTRRGGTGDHRRNRFVRPFRVFAPESIPSSESDVHYWLAIGRTAACNGHAVVRALDAFGDVGGLFSAREHELSELGFSRAAIAKLRAIDWDAVQRDRNTLERLGASVVPIGTGFYPVRLAAIANPPPVLYCRGQIDVLDRSQLAIVGSRAATRGGRERARELARELAACGLVITSGLARGIDTAAHRGAIDVDAPSVAVVATGPEGVYPRSNEGLAGELIEAGAMVTERAPGTPPIAANFPRRNRLISGLSLGVLVVEASLRSGSLITARIAADEGREVFAVPGSVDSALSRGCHALIREGAKLVESVVDVLEELAPCGGFPGMSIPLKPEPRNRLESACMSLGEPARCVLHAVGHDPVTMDQLVGITGMTAGDLAPILLKLELDGRVESLPGHRFVRAGGRKR